jgi:hypothetical protein
MDKVNLQIIRESFGRVAYSHKTHEKTAEIEDRNSKIVKWANIVLTALTSGTLISTIVTNQNTFLYVSAILSSLMLGFMLFQLNFNPAARAEKHRYVAKELWYIREKYVNFMADIINKKLNDELIISKRDQLIEELRLIYRFAPQTDSKAYKKARKALRINEELTFSDEEIDQFLPNELKLKKNLPPSEARPRNPAERD